MSPRRRGAAPLRRTHGRARQPALRQRSQACSGRESRSRTGDRTAEPTLGILAFPATMSRAPGRGTEEKAARRSSISLYARSSPKQRNTKLSCGRPSSLRTSLSGHDLPDRRRCTSHEARRRSRPGYMRAANGPVQLSSGRVRSRGRRHARGDGLRGARRRGRPTRAGTPGGSSTRSGSRGVAPRPGGLRKGRASLARGGDGVERDLVRKGNGPRASGSGGRPTLERARQSHSSENCGSTTTSNPCAARCP